MADPDPNVQLAAALTNIAAILQTLQQQAAPRPLQQAVLQHYDAATPFDLSTRSGSAAYDKACSALPDKWDGSVEKLPNFIIALMSRAAESKWNAPPPNGILMYTVGANPNATPAYPGIERNILTEYHSIPLSDIEDVATNRTNDRAIQNARCFYHCIKNSLEGPIKETMFEQVANLLTQEDGGALLKNATILTMASSLQLTMQTVQQIHSLAPADYDYKISSINTRLIHLFMLASSVNRQLTEPEKIQHTLTTYAKIKQPEAWAQYVRNKVDEFDDNALVNCQKVMNAAALKQSKIHSDLGEFRGRSTTLQEDVVAMLTMKKRTAPRAPSASPKSDPADKKPKGKLPPFVRHFKVSPDKGSVKYVLGEQKTHEGVVWYYCGCPAHRDRIRWHTHPPDQCQIRTKWLETEGGSNTTSPSPEPVAHPADITTTDESATSKETDLSTISGPSDDIVGLLAHALSSVGDNAIAKDLIADAMTALQDV